MTLAAVPTALDDVEIHVASTTEEREAVFRFRYEVYVDELGRYRAVADHQRRQLADPEDDRSWLVYASAGGEVVASLRVTWGGQGFSRRHIDQYQLAPFLTELRPEVMAVGERTTVSPRWRGTDLFSALGAPTSALCAAHDVRIVFGACEPHLLSFYARHQRPHGTRNINSPEAGLLIPLVSFPQGPEALLEFGSDDRLPACVRDALEGTGTVRSPLLLGDHAYGQWVRAALGAIESSVFDGLDEDDLARVIERSNVVTCQAGDRLLRAGGSARNVFVVLDGALAVSRAGEPVGSIGPGEIAGEMAYLLRQPRAFDVDVLRDATQVLSLSERTLARLDTDAPTAAARLTSNISRQLCRRLGAATKAIRPTTATHAASPLYMNH